MAYLIIYTVFAYLIILGQILGELSNGVKPNRWQLAFFLLAPAFLPLYIGYWMFHVVNPDANQKP
jgi:hypothetical protein